jgi:RHS repeat-associated protein
MDNDVKGTGVQYDYGFRIYDARIGKFLSVDPLTKEYPWYTPYQFAGNMPIAAIDLDGGEPKLVMWGHVGMKPAIQMNNEMMIKYKQELINSYVVRIPSSKGNDLHIFDAHRASQDALAIVGVKSTKKMSASQFEAAYKMYKSFEIKAKESLDEYDGLFYNNQGKKEKNERNARDVRYEESLASNRYESNKFNTASVAGDVFIDFGSATQKAGFACLFIPGLEEVAPFLLIPGKAMSLTGNAFKFYDAVQKGDKETAAKIAGFEAADFIFGVVTKKLPITEINKTRVEEGGGIVIDKIKDKAINNQQ